MLVYFTVDSGLHCNCNFPWNFVQRKLATFAMFIALSVRLCLQHYGRDARRVVWVRLQALAAETCCNAATEVIQRT